MIFRKRSDRKLDSSNALNKKALVCSSEAAAISIGIHALLIIFAGSIVAIKYVQKRDAAFAGENIARPKLERRELQMPVKVQNLQKKSRRPKVTSRMASVSQASFSLPDMLGLGNIGGGFDRSGGERSLSSMGSAGSLGFGISGVNFFGAKSKGEKMVFILDAGKMMVEDRRGGYFTYKFAKDRLNKMIDRMRSATLFNVMVYVGRESVMFRPKLVPATPENREALKKWLAPLNSTPSVVGKINNLFGQYNPPIEYEASELTRLGDWMRPVQAAMEQKADNIFILCSGYGAQHVPDEEIIQRYGVESEAKWQESRGWGPEKLVAYKRERKRWKAKAREQLAKENKARAAKDQPPKIVADWWYYIRRELKWDVPGDMPTLQGHFAKYGYKPDQLIGHLDAVYEFNYVPKKLKKPAIHIVKLIAADGRSIDPPGGNRETFRYNSLKQIAKAFGGQFEHLRGAGTVEDLLKYNDMNE